MTWVQRSSLVIIARARRERPGDEASKPVLIIKLAFSLVFTPYLSNAVVSAKSPHYFSGCSSTEAVDIAHKPSRSL